MSADLVQSNQSVVLHIGDECTVGECAFVDVRILGIELKKGLLGSLVDYLHGDTLYNCGGSFGGQRHELFQGQFFPLV